MFEREGREVIMLVFDWEMEDIVFVGIMGEEDKEVCVGMGILYRELFGYLSKRKWGDFDWWL